MILITEDLRARLLANGREPGADPVPVLKLFNPAGAATWLVTELEEEGDTLFGLADLGFGCPELGRFSLGEIEALRLPFGLRIERDLLFEGRFALSVYAEAARLAGHIVTSDTLLLETAAMRRRRE